jgi:hypothetical protein
MLHRCNVVITFMPIVSTATHGCALCNVLATKPRAIQLQVCAAVEAQVARCAAGWAVEIHAVRSARGGTGRTTGCIEVHAVRSAPVRAPSNYRSRAAVEVQVARHAALQVEPSRSMRRVRPGWRGSDVRTPLLVVEPPGPFHYSLIVVA